MSLRIERIDDARDFDHIGRALARHVTHSVARQVGDMVDPRTNPWFRHGAAASFGAFRGREPLGRVIAHIDYRWLAEERPALGRLGLLEFARTPEVARALLERAEDWLREQGCSRVVGPIDPRGILSGGVMTAGFDEPMMIDTPHNPSFYASRLEENGYRDLATLLAWRYYLGRLPVAVRQISHAVSTRPGLELEHVNRDRFEWELDRITSVYNEAWSTNWGFVPVDREEMRHFLCEGRRVDPSMSFVATVDGEPAAIAIACPNYSEWDASFDPTQSTFGWLAARARAAVDPPKGFRQMLFGVVPRYRGRAIGGLGIHLYARVVAAARANGCEYGESMWTLSVQDVLNGGLALMGAEKIKEYRVFQKDL